MIKRLSKAKKNKQGAILVIVVLILALAMIFIASAMMLTQSTRRRLYQETMKSQARLTVTSASEVFLEALKMQEITDEQLDAIINKTHAKPEDRVKMVVAGVPGMSEADNNCTYLDVWKKASEPKLVYCDFTTVIGDRTENVQVVLREEKSNPTVTSQFKNQVEVAGNVGKGELRFTNGCGMWDSKNISRPTDNTIVLRDSYWGQTSGSKYISDVVFGQKATDVNLGGGELFFGRMIFLEGSKMNARSNAWVFGDVYCVGDDDSAGLTIDPNQSGMWGLIAKQQNQNFIFAGRKVQNDPDIDKEMQKVDQALNNGSHKVYFVNSKGETLANSHANRTGVAGTHTYTIKNTPDLTSDMSDSVDRYMDYDYSSSNPFPSSASSVFSKINVDGETGTGAGVSIGYETYDTKGNHYTATATIPNGVTYIKNPLTAKFPTDAYFYTEDEVKNPRPKKYPLDLSSATSEDLKPGYYYVTGSCENSKTDPVVLGIDGSQGDQYRFYFSTGGHLLRGIIFAVYNADAKKPVIFVMENGAKIQFSYVNDSLKSTDKTLCTAGILSIPNRPNTKTFSDICSYITSHNWYDEKKTVTNSEYKYGASYDGEDPETHNKLKNTTVKCTYSQYYDNIVRPAAFIYGDGKNVICLGPDVNIEAYIGLYGKGDPNTNPTATGSGFGTIDGVGENAHQQVYGRVECNIFRTYLQDGSFGIPGWDNPVGGFAMPYCPQPLSKSNTPKQRIAKSKYKVADIKYYY